MTEKGDRRKWKQERTTFICLFGPSMTKTARWGQAEGRSQEFHLNFSTESLRYLSCLSLLPRQRSRKLDQQVDSSKLGTKSFFLVSHRIQGPQILVILYNFPRPQAGIWVGSGATRIRTCARMGFWHVQGENSSF